MRPPGGAAGRHHLLHRGVALLELQREIGRARVEVRLRPVLRAVSLGLDVNERHEDVEEAGAAVGVERLRPGAGPADDDAGHADRRVVALVAELAQHRHRLLDRRRGELAPRAVGGVLGQSHVPAQPLAVADLVERVLLLEDVGARRVGQCE